MVMLAVSLSACQAGIDDMFPKAERPIPARLLQKMKAQGMTASSPIMIRIFKQDNILEVWKQKDNGRFALLETYEICKWSGKLGPKFKEGDRQAPEGFYKVGVHQLNPKSDYHLSFNIGYPNTFDRAHGRTGTHLMVHGACSSAGCYSMNDEQVEEIYALARDALKGGQDYFQVQAYPFRMTPANLAKNVTNPHFEFWKSLKEGYDHFEITNYPPKVDVCEKRYVFNRQADEEREFRSRDDCPPVTMPARLISAYKEKLREEQVEFEKALRRQKLLNGSKDPELASLDPEKVTLVAAGSEVLPPPTPEPEPEPKPEETPAVASASQATKETAPPTAEAQVATSPEATVAAISAQPATSATTALAQDEATGEAVPLPATVPVPVPAERDLAQ